MKQTLKSLGWKCTTCGCYSKKGYDCAHSNFKGVLIQERTTTFRIIKNSHIIESGFAYELMEKLKKHELV